MHIVLIVPAWEINTSWEYAAGCAGPAGVRPRPSRPRSRRSFS